MGKKKRSLKAVAANGGDANPTVADGGAGGWTITYLSDEGAPVMAADGTMYRTVNGVRVPISGIAGGGRQDGGAVWTYAGGGGRGGVVAGAVGGNGGGGRGGAVAGAVGGNGGGGRGGAPRFDVYELGSDDPIASVPGLPEFKAQVDEPIVMGGVPTAFSKFVDDAKLGRQLPYVVSDSHGVPPGGQVPILAAFSTEQLAARFIGLLPDHETGRYSLCGPADDQ